MSAPGIVITGLGLCTPLGVDRETTWRRLLAGESGMSWLDEERRWAGGRAEVDAHEGRVAALAERVACEAWHDSGLAGSDLESERLGCSFGTSKGELCDLLRGSTSPWIDLWPSGAAARLAARWNCRGPVAAPVAACATGLVACIQAAAWIRAGLCDVVLAGSADASLFPAVCGSFQRLGVLAKSGDDPSTACRPFDRRRGGFLIGEGAACLVLERRDHAAARGQSWYGEWIDGRLGCDPTGLTNSDPHGQSLARLLADVVRESPRPPDYVNLHGTATKFNDVAECRAVRAALGTAADTVRCSGMKGSLGHLLGAAGSVELALTLLALRDQVVPPTVNLVEPDPECDLDLTPGAARRMPIATALKVSSGFGGHLAVAAVGR
jgi:3-oxoacyl-[acyl-carrier-protein] synthase II